MREALFLRIERPFVFVLFWLVERVFRCFCMAVEHVSLRYKFMLRSSEVYWWENILYRFLGLSSRFLNLFLFLGTEGTISAEMKVFYFNYNDLFSCLECLTYTGNLFNETCISFHNSS